MTDVKRDKLQDSTLTMGKSSVKTDCQERRAVDSVSESRRKFTKAGLLAPPILMSVSSRPVFGQVACPSQAMSGNLSNQNSEQNKCVLGEGGPEFWVRNLGLWPSQIRPDVLKDGSFPGNCGMCHGTSDTGEVIRWANCEMGTPFSAGFGTNGAYAETTGNSAYRILCNFVESANNPEAVDYESVKVRAYFAAAMLNAYYAQNLSFEYVLRPLRVQKLWTGEFTQDLAMEGRGFVGGSKADAIAFLESTWTPGAWPPAVLSGLNL